MRRAHTLDDIATVSDTLEMESGSPLPKRARGSDDPLPEVAGAPSAPPGAQNLKETFQFAYSILSDLGCEGRDLLAAWMSVGMLIKTAYSGMGCMEMAIRALHRSMVVDFKRDDLSGCGPQLLECCGVLPSCRKVLMSKRGGGVLGATPTHCFGDLQDRLPIDIKMKFHNLQWPTKEWMLSKSDEEVNRDVYQKMTRGLAHLSAPHAFTQNSRSFCYTHGKPCPIDEVSEELRRGERGEATCVGVRLAAGGLICVHWSLQGDMSGFAGESAKPCIVYVEERRCQRELFWFMECTHSPELLQYIGCRLGHLYDIASLIVGPSDFGDPVKRNRLWISGLLRGVVKRTRPMSDMKEVFAKTVTASSRIYYALKPEDVQKFVDNRAKTKRMVAPAGEKFKYNDVMAAGERERLVEYMELRDSMRQAGSIQESDHFVCDLGHACGPMTKVGVNIMATLTRNHVRYCPDLGRALLGPESLAAQGIATKPILDAIAHEKSSLKCEEPVALQRGLEGTTEGGQRNLAGNGMHLRVASAVVAWVLGHAAPTSKMKFGPSHSEMFKPFQSSSPEGSAQQPSGGPSLEFQVGCRLRRGAASASARRGAASAFAIAS